MNLKVLKRSRHKPKAGDIFVMEPPDGLYLFGRVINTEAEIGPIKNCNLLYIYNIRAENKLPIPELSVKDLLLPPMMTNALGWTRGYFEHLENRSLTKKDVLKQHCFFDDFRKCYYDEYGNKIRKPIFLSHKKIDDLGLHSYRTIDDDISTALGIPLSED